MDRLGNVKRWVKHLLFGVLLALMLASSSWAKNPGWVPSYIEGESALQLGPTQAAPSLEAPGLSDRDEFAQFIDQAVADELNAESAPGAAIAIVKDGEIFYTQGYGYADLEQQVPVDASHTRFRVASLSKIFTVTATMQRQEAGLRD